MSGEIKSPKQHLIDANISVEDLLSEGAEAKLIEVIHNAMLNAVIYYGNDIDKTHFLYVVCDK